MTSSVRLGVVRVVLGLVLSVSAAAVSGCSHGEADAAALTGGGSPDRGPTLIRTRSRPSRLASHRATIRVPFPESSAVEPSGFQMTTSAESPSVETTSAIPSEPTPKW